MWLLSGRWPSASWVVAVATFAAFAAYNLFSLGFGHRSCGCFGAVELHPVVLLSLDVAVLAALFVWRPLHGTGQMRFAVLAAIGAILGPVCAMIWSSGQLGALSLTQSNAQEQFVLDLDASVGLPLPILPHIEDSKLLENGDFLLLIVHPRCQACKTEFTHFVTYHANQPKAVLVLGDHSDASQLIYQCDQDNVRVFRLRRSLQVVAMTPLYCRLSSGSVVARLTRP